jgi:8-oxo-dGTP pyrophosphatase MutT (NUDIX family)
MVPPSLLFTVCFLTRGEQVLLLHRSSPPNRGLWNGVGGHIEPGERPLASALREVREETGYKPGSLVALPGFYAANGITAHYAHAFAALDCVEVGAQELDPCEQILVRTFSREQVEGLLDAGRIQDGFTAISLMYYLRRFPR